MWMQCANTLMYMEGDVTKAPISDERPHISLKEGWFLIFWVKGRINYQCLRGSQINHVGQSIHHNVIKCMIWVE
jgi:hypothetical protein